MRDVTSHDAFMRGMRVVPSRISNLERKRGQYQDYGFVQKTAKRSFEIDICGTFEKSPAEAADL